MTPSSLVVAVLAVAVVASSARLLLAHRRDPRRPRLWRLALLLALQPALAVLLYLVLFPPEHRIAPATLTLLTEGARRADAGEAGGERGVLLALPEAADVAGVDRVPDLATALRRNPGTTRVQVLGTGLVPRDRDAAARVSISFDPPPMPRGLLRISRPREVAQGAGFVVHGEVGGVAEGQVELLDPAGRRIDATALAEGGRFSLRGVAFAPGAAAFVVRVRGPGDEEIDSASVPLWIEPATAPRVLLLAGAPNPETRALRRWLEDAGAQVQARIAVGAGLQLGNVPLTDEALAAADLVIVDARAWSALGGNARNRVLAAVRGGLGLLVRADTTMPASSTGALQGTGFQLDRGTATAAWQPPNARLRDETALRARAGIGRSDAPFDPSSMQDDVPALARRSWRVRGVSAVPLSSPPADPAGWWRAEGRGRVGIWTLLDSYRWVQHGRPDLYSELWSPAVATLARSRGNAIPPFDAHARVEQRMAICGLPAKASIESPDGTRTVPLVDPASGDRRCAGFWPRQPGWHFLRAGDAMRAFHVADAGNAQGQRLAELREATLALASSLAPATDAGREARPTEPGRAWPWFLAWLLLAAFAWWFERARLGFAVAAPQQDPSAPLR